MGDNGHSLAQTKKRIFLDAYEEFGMVSAAAQKAGIGRRTHYNWLEADPDYAAAFSESQAVAAQRLEDEAVRRAVHGWEEPVYQGGKQVGTVQKRSDVLLIVLLKRFYPQRYIERRAIEHSGLPEGQVQLNLLFQNVEALRTELQQDPHYLDYLRYRAGNGNGDPRAICQDGKPVVGDGPASGDGRQGGDGHGDGA